MYGSIGVSNILFPSNYLSSILHIVIVGSKRRCNSGFENNEFFSVKNRLTKYYTILHLQRKSNRVSIHKIWLPKHTQRYYWLHSDFNLYCQLTKYSLEKTIRDQAQRLKMQGSIRSTHLSKVIEVESLGKDIEKQCNSVAEQLRKLEVNGRSGYISLFVYILKHPHLSLSSLSLSPPVQR